MIKVVDEPLTKPIKPIEKPVASVSPIPSHLAVHHRTRVVDQVAPTSVTGQHDAVRSMAAIDHAVVRVLTAVGLDSFSLRDQPTVVGTAAVVTLVAAFASGDWFGRRRRRRR